MKIVRNAWSLTAVFLKDFRGAIVSRRFIVVSAIVVILLILISIGLTSVALGSRGAENPLALWQREAVGTIAAFAFAFLPLVIPWVPMDMAYDTRRKNVTTGFLETAVARPIPRWTLALGRYFGLFLAAAIPILLGTLFGIIVIEGAFLTPVPPGFVGAILVGALLILALYLGLTLTLTLVLTPGATRWLSTLLFLVFNLVQPAALRIAGQHYLILQVQTQQTFAPGWGDWVSFTGMYQGFLAPFVPNSLSFVVPPVVTELSGALAYHAVQFAGLVWFLGFLVVFAAVLDRYPLGR